MQRDIYLGSIGGKVKGVNLSPNIVADYYSDKITFRELCNNVGVNPIDTNINSQLYDLTFTQFVERCKDLKFMQNHDFIQLIPNNAPSQSQSSIAGIVVEQNAWKDILSFMNRDTISRFQQNLFGIAECVKSCYDTETDGKGGSSNHNLLRMTRCIKTISNVAKNAQDKSIFDVFLGWLFKWRKDDKQIEGSYKGYWEDEIEQAKTELNKPTIVLENKSVESKEEQKAMQENGSQRLNFNPNPETSVYDKSRLSSQQDMSHANVIERSSSRLQTMHDTSPRVVKSSSQIEVIRNPILQQCVKKDSSVSNYDVYQDITDKATVDKQLNTQVTLTLARQFGYGKKCGVGGYFAIQVGYDKKFKPQCDSIIEDVEKQYPGFIERADNPDYANRLYLPRNIDSGTLTNILKIVESKSYTIGGYEDEESKSFFTQSKKISIEKPVSLQR